MSNKYEGYDYTSIMALKEKPFKKFIIEDVPEFVDWYNEALERTEKREIYPRKKVYVDGVPVMYTDKTGKIRQKMEADKSKKPVIKEVPISFFTLKKAFCEECLKIKKKTPEKKETFRDRKIVL